MWKLNFFVILDSLSSGDHSAKICYLAAILLSIQAFFAHSLHFLQDLAHLFYFFLLLFLGHYLCHYNRPKFGLQIEVGFLFFFSSLSNCLSANSSHLSSLLIGFLSFRSYLNHRFDRIAACILSANVFLDSFLSSLFVRLSFLFLALHSTLWQINSKLLWLSKAIFSKRTSFSFLSSSLLSSHIDILFLICPHAFFLFSIFMCWLNWWHIHLCKDDWLIFNTMALSLATHSHTYSNNVWNTFTRQV